MEELLDEDVDAGHRSLVRGKFYGTKKQRMIPNWRAGHFDKEMWSLSKPAKVGQEVLLTNTESRKEYAIPANRVNKALLKLDQNDAAGSLMFSKKNCRCARNCQSEWTVSNVLELRAQYFKQPSEKTATEFLSHFVQLKGCPDVACAGTVSDSDTDMDTNEPACAVGSKASGVPLVAKREKKWIYSLPVLGTTKRVQVCDRAFEALLGISSSKRTSVKRLVEGGKGAKLGKQFRPAKNANKYTQYSICYSFWHRLFEELCPRPNATTRLFPCAKTNHTIYVEYFTPWFRHNFSDFAKLPAESTFNCARGHSDFNDVKKRPKHYHAQCGDCYRLRRRALKGFLTREKEEKWNKKLRAHEERVHAWRHLISRKALLAKHNPQKNMMLFFDDTGTADFPHFGLRGLKDLPTARVPIIPWMLQNISTGRDYYYYTVKNAYKKGGNRICSQLYHALRAFKTASDDSGRARNLCLVADNYNENKNNTLFCFLSTLVAHDWFDSIELIFGQVGHTHGGDDAQHHIHNVNLGLYFAATLVSWIKNFPRAWLKKDTRPEPVVCHAQYDFDAYYEGFVDELAGFSRTSKDPAYIRGFQFAKDKDGVVRCKVTDDPANGRPYLGEDNTPESEGYVVLKRLPPARRELSVLEPQNNILQERFKKKMLGPRMAKALKGEDQTEALGWLDQVCKEGKVPVNDVIEKDIPAGHCGRLVTLQCGQDRTNVREMTPHFASGEYNSVHFWRPCLRDNDISEIQQCDAPEIPLPNVGYKRVPAAKRPSYSGSAREMLAKKVQKKIQDQDSESDEYEEDVQERVRVTEEKRQVRMVVGISDSGLPKLWFYLPEKKGDQSSRKRRGWWLHDDKDKLGYYYVGPLEDIQSTQRTVVSDVHVLDDFPFEKRVEVDKNGKEKGSTVNLRTARKFTEQELEPAQGRVQAEADEATDLTGVPVLPPKNRRPKKKPEQNKTGQKRTSRRAKSSKKPLPSSTGSDGSSSEEGSDNEPLVSRGSKRTKLT